MDRIHDLLTDDFVDHGPPVSPTPGPDGHITILTFVTTVLQIRYEVHDVICDGDMVAIRASAHGVNAVSPGHRADRSALRDEDRAHYRSRDGRPCAHWGVRDELYQVGALTPPQV